MTSIKSTSMKINDLEIQQLQAPSEEELESIIGGDGHDATCWLKFIPKLSEYTGKNKIYQQSWDAEDKEYDIKPYDKIEKPGIFYYEQKCPLSQGGYST